MLLGREAAVANTTPSTQLYPATEDLEANAEDAMICRICLGDDAPEQMIAPCTCRGSSKFVHRFCLDEWRAQERVNLAFTHCSVCHFAYEFEADSTSESELRKRKVQFGLLVTRDVFLFFVCVQAVIAGLGFVIHWIDRASAGRSNSALYDLPVAAYARAQSFVGQARKTALHTCHGQSPATRASRSSTLRSGRR